MEKLLQDKAQKIISLTINDNRWDLTNETMFQVFGLTVSGFLIGVGRNLCFLDSGLIAKSLIVELTRLGAGEKYVEGLVDYAFNTFENETKSYQSDLVGIGYSYFASENLNELKESIFSNTKQLSVADKKNRRNAKASNEEMVGIWKIEKRKHNKCNQHPCSNRMLWEILLRKFLLSLIRDAH